MKLACYGVRESEKSFFNKINEKYNHQLLLIDKPLTKETVHFANGFDGVVLRGSCVADKDNLETLSNNNVKYILTRSAGFNHIDLDSAKKFNLSVAYVPRYSPNAIAELALALTMSLARNTQYATNRTKDANYAIDEFMFGKEVRNSIVGVIGLGNIGFTAAKIFKGVGAKVIGYDPMPKENVSDVLEQVELDYLLNTADIITIHMPYIKNTNDDFINKSVIEKMKDNVILVNTSRGEILNIWDVLEAVEKNKIKGFATDVLRGENKYFPKDLSNEKMDDLQQKFNALYPRVLVTPHLGAYTDLAVANMIETTFENLAELILTKKSKNQLI